MVTSASTDPAFFNIAKTRPGFHIWRVENLSLTPVSRENYGKFYKGDSYVIYSINEKGNFIGSTKKYGTPGGSLEAHIHFWIGSETSQDEAAVAAVKTVELDTLLGGSPIQHRETEGNESQRFLSYFKQGIRYLTGGVTSGLKQVKDNFQPSLYHVKGKRMVILYELPKIAWTEMNEGDVYIFDIKRYIFVWIGKYSNYQERIQAAKYATKMKDERGSGHIIVLEDGQEGLLSGDELKDFNDFLPLNDKRVLPANTANEDELFERKMTYDIKLFRCSDESGTLKVTEVKNGPFSQSDLSSDDSYILDNGPHDIWVWIGKKATTKEREEALRNAQGFISKKGYPLYTKVSRIVDGGEPVEFKALFKDWKEKDQSHGWAVQAKRRAPFTTIQTKFDAAELHHRPAISAETQLVDDGSGEKEVWRVKKFELVEVPEKMFGEFFMGDCYVILYAYQAQHVNYIIYYWIGSEASADEAGTAALKAIELDDKLEGRAVQVRVTQGKEPPHFMAIFGGRMIIYEGGFASAFDGPFGRDVGKKSSYMLQVRGSTSMTTKAVEVDLRAGCLNSNDCFVISTPQQTYIWCGKGSTGDEREVAKTLAKAKGDPILISEGNERSDFWEILGGKEEYASSPKLREEKNPHEPRLFQISNTTGILKAEDVPLFSQEDLVEDDIMLLDSWESIFLWVGRNANKEERKGCEELALEYLRTDPAGRSTDTPIIKIKQGFEPPNFTGFFGVWNNNLWNNDETYADICKRFEETSPGATILISQPNSAFSNGDFPKKTFPISVLLLTDLQKLPEDVDPTRKEDYLCEADFDSLFRMERDTYDALPLWKKLNLKKKVGLF